MRGRSIDKRQGIKSVVMRVLYKRHPSFQHHVQHKGMLDPILSGLEQPG